ncbi:non-ribosomal peptide synthetase [Streptomyces pseudovenezuelae]|uniref:Amino acid adenylation domain-containing protein n=1 Tax=Streptomyces pseudovenezuelae TaxID=67350 RepID=A0ABT6M0P5_9ACTN|nr:non-ribosomal peptide synthetase [Streptomyces pseudovenezuelae]MDH6222142.1 amino acid adenylation domain-containing protein [Streptomyces pseudovenezuelae]
MSVPTARPRDQNEERLRALLAARTTRVARPTTAGDAPVPLRSVQRRFWFEAQLHPESPAYNVPVLLRLRGPLDREALLDAVVDLADRHRVLRGVVDAREERPVLVLRPAGEVLVDLVDLTAHPDSAGEFDRRVRESVRRPFALDREVPLRVSCFTLAPDDHALLLVLHHIATDAHSNELLIDDLAALYAARTAHAAPPPAPTQYADIPDDATGPLAERRLQWWEERLKGLESGLDLPTDHPRGTGDDMGGKAPLTWPEDVPARVRALAQGVGCTPFVVFLAVWQTLLSRISGSHDIAVGVPEGGRRAPGSTAAVGLFVNTVVVRTNLSGDPTGRELLERVRTDTLDALDHADAPFDRVVERLRPQRIPGSNGLFDTMVNLYRRPDVGTRFPGVEAELAEAGTGYAKTDLTLRFVEEEGGLLRGVLEYRSALFDPATAERIADWYTRLLQGLLNDPDRVLSAVALADPETSVVRGPVRDYPLGRPLAALFEDWADAVPDTVAVVASDGSLTYRELEEQANRIARRLLSLGVRADEPVAILSERGLALQAALLGVLKAGAAFVTLEPSYPDDRLNRTVQTAGARIVLAERALDSRVRAEHVLVVEDLVTDPGLRRERPVADVRPEHLAYVVFTSGSTGVPKGVAVQHRSIVHYLHAVLERVDGHGRSFALLSTAAADLGFVSLFGPLISGGTLHLVARETATDPGALADYLRRHRVDVVKMVPSHLELLAAHGDLATVLPRQTLILAGEACPWSLADRIRAARPDLVLHNHYGPTETTVSVLGCDLAQVPPGCGAVAPLGRPFPNAVCYVVDPAGRILPPTVAGELLLAGPGVARGYLGDPAATGRAYVPDPLTGEDRCYRTGDRVRVRADGLIEFLGRLDDQIKVRGHRVEPGEVAAVCRKLPTVRDAVVLASGEAHRSRLVAWLVPQGGETLDLRTARSALREALPEHMVPAALVPVREIPLTPNGKVDRAALPEPGAEQHEERIAPGTPTERHVARVWNSILGLEENAPGVDEDFFNLGGDSFSALRAARAIDPALRVIDLFARPTVRELAAFLDEHTEADDRLLQRLAGPPAGATPALTVVCLPYAGGSSASYLPLAERLATWAPGVEVLAVELPGHDPARPEEPLLALTELIGRCRAELDARTTGDLLVYGHCMGTAAAAALALELEAGGRELTGVVLAAAFPAARLPGRLATAMSRRLPSDRWISNRRYREGLQALGGQLEEETETAIMRGLRHDVREAIDWFSSQLSDPGHRRLRAPLLCVIGEGDRTTELFTERYEEWYEFADRVELAVIPDAGHYFMKHQAAELATIVTDTLTSWQRAAGTTDGDIPAAGRDKKTVRPVHGGRRPRFSAQAARRDLLAFYRLALSQVIALTGSALTTFGLGIWVFQRTGEVGYYALITMLAVLPAVFASPLGGAVADRYEQRTVMLYCNIVYGVVLTGLIGLVLTGRLQVWEIAVFATTVSLANAFHRPAYLASVSRLVPKPYLAQAAGLAQMGNAVSTLVAPLAGGVLIGLIGLRGLIWTDLGALLVGIGVLLSVRFPDRLFRKRRETFRAAILGGWRFIVRRRPLVVMVVFFVVVNLVTSMATVLTAPLVLSGHSPAVLGLVTAAGGLGAVAGGVTMALWGGTRRRADGMVGLVVGVGLAMAVIGLSPSPVLIAIGLFLWWACNTLLNAHWLAIIQAKVGLELQGRVLATNQMLAMAMMPVGFLLTPVLTEHVFEPLMAPGGALVDVLGPVLGTGSGRGMGLLMVTGGLLLAGWGLLGLRYHPLRRMEDLLPDIHAGATVGRDLEALQDDADALQDQRDRAVSARAEVPRAAYARSPGTTHGTDVRRPGGSHRGPQPSVGSGGDHVDDRLPSGTDEQMELRP